MQRDTGTYHHRDATSLVHWVRLSLYAQVVISMVAVMSGALEYQILTGLRDGTFPSQEAAIGAAEASDARQGIVGMLQTLVYIFSGFLILRWIHRANWNARALGAHGMQFTPGWSIGWYFVPFLNLWKPYQAMKEIWKASHAPHAWQPHAVPSLLGNWWGLWLLTSMLSNGSLRLTLRAEDIGQLLSANMVTVASDLSGVVLALVFLVLLRRVDEAQSRSLQGPAAVPAGLAVDVPAP